MSPSSMIRHLLSELLYASCLVVWQAAASTGMAQRRWSHAMIDIGHFDYLLYASLVTLISRSLSRLTK